MAILKCGVNLWQRAVIDNQQNFRLGLGNWFETQQRIIRRIATSLNVQLSTERLMRLYGVKPGRRAVVATATSADEANRVQVTQRWPQGLMIKVAQVVAEESKRAGA